VLRDPESDARRVGAHAADMKMTEDMKERRARQAIEGVQAMADYRAAEEATLANTACYVRHG